MAHRNRWFTYKKWWFSIVMMDILWYSGWWCNNHLEKYEFVNGKDDVPYMKWKIKNVPNRQPVFVYMCCFVPNIRSPECHNYVHVGFSFYMYLKVCMKNVSIKSDFILSCHILSKLVYSKSKCNIIHLSLVLPPTYIYNKPLGLHLDSHLSAATFSMENHNPVAVGGPSPQQHTDGKSRQRLDVAWFPHIIYTEIWVQYISIYSPSFMTFELQNPSKSPKIPILSTHGVPLTGFPTGWSARFFWKWWSPHKTHQPGGPGG